MPKDQPGVLRSVQRSASETAACDEINRRHPPIEGLVVPHDLRKLKLHGRTGQQPPD